MLDTVDFNHVQHISFTQSRLTDAVSVILSELLSYEHPPNGPGRAQNTQKPGKGALPMLCTRIPVSEAMVFLRQHTESGLFYASTAAMLATDCSKASARLPPVISVYEMV